MRIVFGEDDTYIDHNDFPTSFDVILGQSYINDGFKYFVIYNNKNFKDWVTILRWLNDVYEHNNNISNESFTNKKTRNYVAFNDQWQGIMVFLFKSEEELIQFKLAFSN